MAKAKKNSSKDSIASANMKLRVIAGLAFLLPGLAKLWSLITTGSHPVTGLLWGSVALAWILALVEVVAGAMLITERRVDIAAIALGIVAIGAIVLANNWANFISTITSGGMWLHVVAVAVFYKLYVDAK